MNDNPEDDYTDVDDTANLSEADKKSIDSFEDDAPRDVDIDPEELREACRQSIDYTAAVTAPHIYRFPFPEYYRAIFAILALSLTAFRDYGKYALGFPRGFAKTTFVKFIVIWAVFFSKKKNIVVICANMDPLAKNFMADLIGLLDHPNTIKLFGNWRIGAPKTTNTDIEFFYKGRMIKISGVGVGTSLRGMVRDGSRPDFIVLDDIQSKEDAKSETVSKELLDWLYSTVNFLRSPFGCTYVFLANMYATPHSILKKLMADPEWQTYVASGITEDGDSLWEDLHPIEQLLSDYRSLKSQNKEDIFLAELMNIGDLNASLTFDAAKLKVFSDVDIQNHQGAFILIDPSGRKKTSDDTAMGVFVVIDGIPVSVELISEIMTPKETIKNAFQLAAKWGASLICAEDVAYQDSLLFWFEEAIKELGIVGLYLIGINPGGLNKNYRLINIIKSSQVGELGFVDNTKAAFESQVYGFNPLVSKNKDDVLDIHAYAPVVVKLHVNLISLNSPFAEHQELPLIEEIDSSPF